MRRSAGWRVTCRSCVCHAVSRLVHCGACRGCNGPRCLGFLGWVLTRIETAACCRVRGPGSRQRGRRVNPKRTCVYCAGHRKSSFPRPQDALAAPLRCDMFWALFLSVKSWDNHRGYVGAQRHKSRRPQVRSPCDFAQLRFLTLTKLGSIKTGGWLAMAGKMILFDP